VTITAIHCELIYFHPTRAAITTVEIIGTPAGTNSVMESAQMNASSDATSNLSSLSLG